MNLSNIKLHSIAFFSLFFIYFFSVIFFNTIFINPHDNLDLFPIYNSLIKEIYIGNFESVKILQAENFKWYYLEQLLYPSKLFQLFLDHKQFYFFEDISKKIISYFSFYILAKSLTKKKFSSMIGAILYVTLTNIYNIPFTYFLPFAPYIVYLLQKKNEFNKKHLFCIFLISLNSSLIFDYLSIIIIIPLSIYLRILNKKIINTKILKQYFAIFTFGCFITAIPIFYAVFTEELHRELILKENIYEEFSIFIKSILDYFSAKNLREIFSYPLKILFFFTFITAIIFKDKKSLIIFLILFLYQLLVVIVSSNLFNFIFIGAISFLKGFNFTRFNLLFPLLISLIVVLNLNFINKKTYTKFIFILVLISTISIQSQIFFTEIFKSFFGLNLKENYLTELKKHKQDNDSKNFFKTAFNRENYKPELKFDLNLENSFTFDNYYKFEDYKNIKKIVKDSIVISVGIDPMVAAMNKIKVADGYYTLYSKAYKIRFRKIIEQELEKNEILRKYFDDWGNRAYIFYSDKENLALNFKGAKDLNVKYVISAFKIYDKNLIKVCSPCNKKKNINLYKIN